MRIIVAYDIVRNRRRTKMHRFLRELGLNTQKSVFECEVSPEELEALRRYPDARLDMREDSLNIYHLCSRCAETGGSTGVAKILKDYGRRAQKSKFEVSLTHPRLKSPQRDIGRPSIRPRTHSSRGLRSSFCFRPDAPACRSR